MTAPWPIIALLGVLGLAVGSFLNVVIYRVPRDESIMFPSSHCPACNEPIKARHNVPVFAWLALRGRCASCGDRISVRYPLVEAGTSLLFMAITIRFGLTLQLPAYLYMAAVGIALGMIDFDARRLPDTIVLPSYIVSLLLLMPAGALHANFWQSERALAGMTAFALIFFGLAVAYPSGITFGDVKLAGLVGFYLGWLSWSAIAIGVLLSFAFAGFGGTAVAATHRGTRVVAVPLGSYLIAASVLSLFVAAPISAWYGHLLAL